MLRGCEQRRVEQGQAEVGQQCRPAGRGSAAGTTLVTRGANSITRMVTTPTTMPCQLHCAGRSQRVPEMGSLGTPRNFGIWLPMMIKPDSREVAADHRIGHVLDQAAQAEAAEHYLQQARDAVPQGDQQQYRLDRSCRCCMASIANAVSTAAAGAQGAEISRLVPPTPSATRPSAVAPRMPASAPTRHRSRRAIE